MDWTEVFVVLLVSHLAGDFLLQTEHQALDKFGGLRRGRPRARRALFSHVTCYTATFVPALVWMASELGAGELVAVAAGVFVPHLIVDDGALVTWWMQRVKSTRADPGTPLYVYVDQSAHVVTLFALAVVVGT